VKQVVLQCSLLSNFDNGKYSAEEIATKAMLCQKAGACVVHVHRNKLYSLDEFIRMAQMLEVNNGPALNLSVSDYKEVISLPSKMPSSIRFASMQSSDCRVFGTKVIQSLQSAKAQMKDYFDHGFIPELILFNRQGVENCLELYQSYPHQFYPNVHLGFPDEFPATQEIVSEIMEKLRPCGLVSFNVFNNQDDDLLDYIIRSSGHIRSGLEDSDYYGKKKAIDSVEIMLHIAERARLCGYEPTSAAFIKE
jgi:uncharacterized protein (DUF849 family)